MRVAIRVDASIQIGSGHFMRCLTLADTLRKQGALIRFVSQNLPAHLCDMLATKGMEFAALKSEASETQAGDLAHSHWLGASQRQDGQDTIQALTDHTWDRLVVDHYAQDVRWESAMRTQARHIMVVDDLADRRHDCEVLLDQNFYENMQTRYTDKVPAHCRLLLGPRYALLRDEFRRFRKHIKPRTGPIKRILVFFGGVDTDNYTGLAIQALSGLDIKGIHVDVVIGAIHPQREQIERECTVQGYACHVQTTRMAELMAAADLAIGAGGSASWERCCLGLPALLVVLAENQIDIIKALRVIGACVYIKTSEIVTSEIMRFEINRLLIEYNKLELISQRSFALVDGAGVDRVTELFGHQK